MLIALAALALIAPGDPDGVVTTAPRGADSVVVGAVSPTSEAAPDAARAGSVTPQDLTTAQQIDRWLSAGTRPTAPFADDRMPPDDRKMHGFVSGSIGTDDYSSVAVGVSLPIGESGRLDLRYSQTRNGYGYGYPGYGYGGPGDYGDGYGYHARPFGGRGPFFGAATRSGRSVGLGLRWEEDKDLDAQAPIRSRGMTARD